MKATALRRLEELLTRYPALASTGYEIGRAASVICDTYRNGGKVLVCGNGGSAADSEHIVGELMKGFYLRREIPEQDAERMVEAGCGDLVGCLQQGIPAIALTGHVALSTAVLNDNDPYVTFAQQVYVYGRKGDVLLGLSTSGNARNVVNALRTARAFGVSTIGFTGKKSSSMDECCDVIIKVPEEETFKVQELHLPVYHAICLMVEEEIFGE